VRKVTCRALVALAMVSAMALNPHAAAAADLQIPTSAPTAAGGWLSIALQEDMVVNAAKFAVIAQSRHMHSDVKLLSIKHARQQVVAGTNYSMNLMVQAEGKHHLVIAVVWVKLDGSMELTRWHWV
jgi:hypothetical protein